MVMKVPCQAYAHTPLSKVLPFVQNMLLVQVHLLTDTTFDFNRPNLLVNVEISIN